eukprot:935615-Prymnesium_polylepis.2
MSIAPPTREPVSTPCSSRPPSLSRSAALAAALAAALDAAPLVAPLAAAFAFFGARADAASSSSSSPSYIETCDAGGSWPLRAGAREGAEKQRGGERRSQRCAGCEYERVRGVGSPKPGTSSSSS